MSTHAADPPGYPALCEWLYATRYSANEKALILYLYHRGASPDSACWVSRKRMAGDLSLSEPTVRRCLARLVADGMVERFRRGRKDTTLTFLHLPAEIYGVAPKVTGHCDPLKMSSTSRVRDPLNVLGVRETPHERETASW